jgi:UDP-glucose-4-epimerase GalE
MNAKPILVTGGAGYIGSHVCHRLARLGYRPIVLDNLSRGHRQLAKWGVLVEGDVGDGALVKRICEEYQPLAAMHFAAFIEVAESVRFPEMFFENNTRKARVLFDTLAACGVSRVIFSSTAAVYGMPATDAPLHEETPLKPINPYGESKLAAESYLRAMPDMRSFVLRYFNASGASESADIGEAHWPESHLIPNALLCALGRKKTQMEIYGQDYSTIDGTALRDYIHVEDLAEAHVLALGRLLEGGQSDIVNLGTSKGYTVRQVMETVRAVTGSPLECRMMPRRAGDPATLVADNEKAKRVLGWQPERDLAAIVASACRWHRSENYDRLISNAIERAEAA